jgi:hypothetical protein
MDQFLELSFTFALGLLVMPQLIGVQLKLSVRYGHLLSGVCIAASVASDHNRWTLSVINLKALFYTNEACNHV